MQASLRYKVSAIWRDCMYVYVCVCIYIYIYIYIYVYTHTHTHKAFTLSQINFPLGYTTFHVKAGGFCYPTLFSVQQ